MNKFQTSLKPEQPHCHHVHIEIHRDTYIYICIYIHISVYIRNMYSREIFVDG